MIKASGLTVSVHGVEYGWLVANGTETKRIFHEMHVSCKNAGMKRPTDRFMPRKGAIRWNEMFQLLHEKGYTGFLSFEAPNPEQWERSPVDVCCEGIEFTQDLLRNTVPEYAA